MGSPNGILASAAHTYFGVGDHQNLRRESVKRPITVEKLRTALNVQLLFSDRLFLVAEDMLVNERLMSLLVGDYRSALEGGVFVPVLRDQYDDIKDCAQYLTQRDYYNQTGDHIWRRYLDEVSSLSIDSHHFDPDEAYEHFTDAMRACLHSDGLLDDIGLGFAPVDIENRVQAVVSAAGRKSWRRSALFEVSDQFKRIADRRALRELSSVIYNSHLAGLFKQSSVIPDWYSRYVTILSGIDLGASSGDNVAPSWRVERSMANSRLQDLGQLSAADIIHIRESKEFVEYIFAVREGKRQKDILAELTLYLDVIDQYVGEKMSGLASNLTAIRRNAKLLSYSSGGGTLFGLADVAVGTNINPWAMETSWVLAASGVVFLFLEKFVGRAKEARDIDRAKFWTDYCGGDGTFAAQIAGVYR